MNTQGQVQTGIGGNGISNLRIAYKSGQSEENPGISKKLADFLCRLDAISNEPEVPPSPYPSYVTTFVDRADDHALVDHESWYGKKLKN